jgi:hypothetical protein
VDKPVGYYNCGESNSGREIMIRIKIAFLIMFVFAGILLPGCSGLETDLGSVAGAVFYTGNEVRVAGAWVRLYEPATLALIAETQVDVQSRFFFSVPEGEYLIRGASSQNGTYSGPGDVVAVFKHSTRTIFFAIDELPPT